MMSDNISPLMAVEDALNHILGNLQQTQAETIPITEAAGRILAEDVEAEYSHPAHAISAMDGYAVMVTDGVLAENTPLELIGEAAAGHPFSGSINSDQAVRIFTGAYMPHGANAVLIQEDVRIEQDKVIPTEDVKEGQFVRPAGLDFETGHTIAKQGELLSARRWALVCLSGKIDVAVRKRPLIGILSSGDELVAAGTQPAAGQLINSNSLYLRQLVETCGGVAVDLGIIADKAGALTTTLETARAQGLTFDMIISTGGASVGTHDHIHADLSKAGNASLNFWKIAMRPGKPVLCARWHDTTFIGLPGNPVSAGVCGLVFIMPALRKLLGQSTNTVTSTGYLTTPLAKNDTRQDYLRASISEDKTGKIHVEKLGKQDSSMLRIFTEADALIIRPPFAPPAEIGDAVEFLKIPNLL